MPTEDGTDKVSDIPSQICEIWCVELKKKGVSAELIERLREAVGVDSKPSHATIRNAVFPEDA